MERYTLWILVVIEATYSLGINIGGYSQPNNYRIVNDHPKTPWPWWNTGSHGDSSYRKSSISQMKKDLLTEGIKMAAGHVTIRDPQPCPCQKPSWCEMVRQKPEKEVFIFSIRNDTWRRYDWDKITTIATFNYLDDEVMCWAHSRGIKVVHGADYPKNQLTNSTARHLWVNQTLGVMTSHFLDGINVDFEDGISAKETPQRDGLTLLMKELSQAAKNISPYTQITFDFASTPDTTWRQYDYKAIADVLDFAFIMDYDEIGGKYAEANSAYDKTKHGMERFLAIGIPGNKLILGAPWYGYWFRCEKYDTVYHRCSPTGQGQLDYNTILHDFSAYSFTGRLWDPVAKSPFFSVKDPIDRSIFQIRYDDQKSLRAKFDLISSLGLLGAGNWHADSINYSDPAQVKEMWGAFP